MPQYHQRHSLSATIILMGITLCTTLSQVVPSEQAIQREMTLIVITFHQGITQGLLRMGKAFQDTEGILVHQAALLRSLTLRLEASQYLNEGLDFYHDNILVSYRSGCSCYGA